jgi:transcriptional regulator with GAF, ATPase, and Fis domain
MEQERSPLDVARMFADVAGTFQSHGEFDRILTQVVRSARQTIGCDHAGVTIRRRNGTVDSPALTGEIVKACDRAQIETGEGPCLETLDGGGPLLRVDDMTAERRWPKFAARAAELGVHSMLSCRLTSRQGLRASLNLHCARPHAFDEAATGLAEVFAVHASIALAYARQQQTLESALASRQTIGEATGVVMARYQLTAEEAFEVLVRASQHRNVKLRDVAAEVLRDGPRALNPDLGRRRGDP